MHKAQSTISKWLGNNTSNIHVNNACNVAPEGDRAL